MIIFSCRSISPRSNLTKLNLILLLSIPVFLTGCDNNSGSATLSPQPIVPSPDLALPNYHQVQTFIDSNGSQDFDINLIANLHNDFEARHAFFYKYYLYNNKNH